MLIGVSEGKIPVKTRSLLEKGLSMKGTTRSSAIDFQEVMKWLTNEDFQKSLKKAVFPKKFNASNSNEVIEACKVAERPETFGKVLIDWRHM